MHRNRKAGRLRNCVVGVVGCAGVVVLAGCASSDVGTGSPVDTGAHMAGKLEDRNGDAEFVRLAERAIDEKRFEDAKRIVERIFLSDPENRVGQLLWAEILLAKGTPDDAIRMFEKLEDDQDFTAKAAQGRGLALIRQREFNRARVALERAVSLDARLWRSWNALGYLHDFKREWEDAAAAYDRAIAASPDNAIVYNNRGYSRILQKHYDSAADDLRSALRLKPDLRSAQINLQLALALGGHYERALVGVRKASRGEALNNVGYMALIKGEYEKAQSLFVQALEVDASYNITVHQNLEYLAGLERVATKDSAKTQ